MLNYMLLAGVFLCVMCGAPACHRRLQSAEDPTIWKKIHLDFKKLDAEGRSGPPGGKVAVNYEFCIPAEEKYWREVKKIDQTLTKNAGKGRAGCREGQWLVIGSTRQARYQRVLYDLAARPYVERIEETFWE